MRHYISIAVTAAIFCTTASAATTAASAAELTYKVVDTGQTLFYDNSNTIKQPKMGEAFYGQDAHYSINTPSYTDNGDGTITDNVTGLMWQKAYQLLSYNEAAELARKSKLAGHKDWRVPTIKEAYSLILFSGVDASGRDMSVVPEGAIPFIATDYFDFAYGSNGTRVIDTQMLSETKSIGSLSGRMPMVFGVNMADGRIKSYPLNARDGEKKFTVRFVRGTDYGVNKFKANKNGTVSDEATGLMWQQDDSGKGLNWADALEYAAKMNKKKMGGYSDWRLPNAKELQSIIDYSRSPESSNSAAIDPVFKISSIKNEKGEQDYPYFWSSTTHVAAALRGGGGGAAAYLSFGRSMGNIQMGQGGFGGGQMRQGGGNNGGNGGGQRGGNGGNGSGYGGGGNQQYSQQMQQGGGNMRGGNNGGGYGGGNSGGQRSQQMGGGAPNGAGSSNTNWINIHGAGSQRSDPKSGDPEQYQTGRGPQGDAIRIKNYVRLVRTESK